MNQPSEPALGEALRAAMACDAQLDAGGRQFPDAGIAVLRQAGWLRQPPLAPDAIDRLLTLLADIAWGDLAVARIYEGHVNALWLIERFGAAEQWALARQQVDAGLVFGVWNTDDPADPLRLQPGPTGEPVLTGRKTFASGADGVDVALVTAETGQGRRMLLVPLNGRPVDRNWWRPQGMRLSGSHVVDFAGVTLRPQDMVGEPDDYITQPWFSGGAIRFAAAHVGGMRAVHDALVDHLCQTDRCDDPYQQHRIARSAILVETGYLWLRRAADAWRRACVEPASAGAELEAIANATRMAVETAALEVLELAERGVGAAGLMQAHPLERLARDLRTYLRQPAPDRALAQCGRAVAARAWSPGQEREPEQ